MDSDTDMASVSTEIYSRSSASTEVYSVGTSASSGRYQLDILPGHWGPIRLYREAHFDDENQLTSWLEAQGLIYSSMYCRVHRIPRTRYSRTDGHRSWYCGKCSDRIGIYKDSIFERSKISPSKVLMLAYSFANRCGYAETKRNLIFDSSGVLTSDETIAFWFDLFRDLLVDTLDERNDASSKIGGPGKVVQVDEAIIGRRKYHRGRLIQGTWVIGLIDEDGDIRLEVTPRRDAQTLQAIIQRHVHSGSDIHSDGWRGYIGLANRGFDHHTVNHSEEFVAEDGTHTQRIESQWRALRRYFSPGGRRHEDIPTILAEYTWRRRCLFNNLDPFTQLLRVLKIE